MQSIDFEAGAVANLRRRVAEVEEINEDLVAFARGHAGAVTSIHNAVLAAIAATDISELLSILTFDWPALLKVDQVALVWSCDGKAFRTDLIGTTPVEPRLVGRMVETLPSVTIRPVEQGHPLFGTLGGEVRSEALIRLSGDRGCGLLALGQLEGGSAEGRHGTRLLRFLGQALSHMLERCTTL